MFVYIFYHFIRISLVKFAFSRGHFLIYIVCIFGAIYLQLFHSVGNVEIEIRQFTILAQNATLRAFIVHVTLA